MKYLKLYESYKLFEANGDDMLFLNRAMISDLKDLCMELFDKGFSLIIYFYPKPTRYCIGYVTINHEIDNYSWNKYIYPRIIYRYNKNEQIKYVWGFKMSRQHPSITHDESSEIDYRIRAMYPNEDIKYSKSYFI